MTTPARTDAFAALGDSHRRAIVLSLSRGEKSVQELADGLPISRPAVSRHLRLLRDAGLVTDRADGVRRMHSLDRSGVADMRAFMEEVWGDAVARFKVFVESTGSQ